MRIAATDYVLTAAEGDLIRVADGTKAVEKVGGLAFARPVLEDGSLIRIEQDASRIQLPAGLAEGRGFQTLWEAKIQGSRHDASPVIHDDLVYAVSREGWLTVLDAQKGEVIYERELKINGDNTNSVYPSVSLAGGHLYIGFEEGEILVLKPGREFVEVAKNSLEPFRGTPIFHGDRIYLRGLENLYCLGSAGN